MITAKSRELRSVRKHNLTAPSVTPRRETSTVYHSFPATSIFPSEPSIFDHSDSVTVNGNGSEGGTDHL